MNNPMNPSQVIVVGGGAIGLSLAWELSGRGVGVTLIDSQSVGKATSWSAGGILPPANLHSSTDPIDRLRGLSHQLFPKWTSRLAALTGIDSGFRQCGAWYLADTPGEKAAMVGMTEYWRELEIPCQQVNPETLAAREPALRQLANTNQELAAWWVPDEYQVRCPDYLKALAAACRGVGVRLIEDHQVSRFQHDPSGVQVIANDRAGRSIDLQADALALAAGAWTGRLAESLQLQHSTVPVRGQMLLLKTSRPLFRPIINVGHRYLISRDDGHVLVGSCEEEVGFRLGTTDAMIESLRSFALQICPELSQAEEVRRWSGLRPMTFDGFPMIGRVPATDNVFVAAGHFRSGIHLSPGTAVCLADAIVGKQPEVSLGAFRVGKQQHQGAEITAGSFDLG